MTPSSEARIFENHIALPTRLAVAALHCYMHGGPRHPSAPAEQTPDPEPDAVSPLDQTEDPQPPEPELELVTPSAVRPAVRSGWIARGYAARDRDEPDAKTSEENGVTDGE